MKPSQKKTSHVFDALAPKRGELSKIIAQVDAAHRRLAPIRRCHPWRARVFPAKPAEVIA